ncbi:hypothetical protein AAU57_09270 [Nonlabens sp. YIK11]|uniref:hypothetical protein n=1 Tax=Nonlabens sp. YIK11 TaxID=1453349 RepID=UPI0006DC43C6|nr:hypothetical protein [Nonlabens sp. YIK11]KQC33481.1 hypothetical protein AAU57_09270 [Nonlabens sp. YIK11]
MISKITRISILLFLSFTSFVLGQVGVNTTNPQNDLHVNGGVRITTANAGSETDASQRILARDTNGDLVNVTRDQALENAGIPRVVYSSKYAFNGGTPFFGSCNPCAANELLNLYLVNGVVEVNNNTYIQLDQGTAINGDESFVINEEGFFTFDLQTSISLVQSSIYYINFRIRVERATGVIENDILRVYAGSPANTGNGQIGQPINFKDVRRYYPGDRISFAFSPAFGSNAISNGTPTGSSYGAQLIVSRFN